MSKNPYWKDFVGNLGMAVVMFAALSVAAMFLYGFFTILFSLLGQSLGTIALFAIIILGLVAFTTYLQRVADDADE